MRISHVLGIAVVAAMFATGATMFFTGNRVSASPQDSKDAPTERVDDKLRERGTEDNAPENKAVVLVYPVESIEKWEETLPKGLPGNPHRLRLDENRELMLATHFPYLNDGDSRTTLVNFQREYHRQIDSGATLIWTDGVRAYFSRSNIKLTKNARVGRDD